MSFTFLTAEWRKLIMAQYEVAPELLASRLPPGLELDLFDGRCFVSLVGFLFDRVRILGVPIPFHTRFEEVNLRYYVRRPMPDGSARRGVIFLSEIVPKPAITLVARALYGEAYSTAPTRHSWRYLRPRTPTPGTHSADPAASAEHRKLLLEVHYDWKHHRLPQHLGVRADAQLRPLAPGSLEEFITEHYYGYTRTRRGGTAEYAVEHARWQVYPVREHRVSCDFASLYGADFANLANRPPDHLLLAEGAPVSIRWGGRIA